MISLRKVAKDKGLRQKDVAASLGMSDATVSNWFNRAATIPTQFIGPIAEVLGLEPGEVLAVAVALPADAPAPELTTCPTCGMLRATQCAPSEQAA